MNLSDKFQEYLYSRYPSVYRIYDEDLLLQRFTYALTDPAIPLIKKLEMMHDVLDIGFCPDSVIPRMYNNFGALYDDELSTSRQRKILRNIVDLLKYKGTGSVIEYIVSELTGIRTTIQYSPDPDDRTHTTLRLDMDYDLYNENIPASKLREVLEEFLPFYMVMTIVYVYKFMDSASMSLTEGSSDLIKELMLDSSALTVPELFKQAVVLIHTESGSAIASEYERDTVKSSLPESSSLLIGDTVSSKVRTASPRNAMFALCDFGVAVFGNDEFIETTVNY